MAMARTSIGTLAKSRFSTAYSGRGFRAGLTAPSGRALAGMLAVFAGFERDILTDRVKAGSARARKESSPLRRPQTVAK
jgi:DNA invertase Pin-like site-specific DNA recombinase